MISIFRGSLELLDARSRRILIVLVLVQVILSALDLIGVLIVGLVAGLAAASLESDGAPVALPVQLPGVTLEDPSVILVLTIAGGLMLIVKSVLAFALMRRSYKFLASRQAAISSHLAGDLLRRPLLDVQRRSSQETAYALTGGVNAAVLGVIGSGVLIVAETSVFAVLFVGLLIIDPLVGVFTVLFFGLIGFILQRFLGVRGGRLGTRLSISEVGSIAGMQEAIRTYRETTVSGRRDFFTDRFQDLRWQSASVQADVAILSQLSKYVFEISLVVGAGLLAASQFLTRSIPEAVAVVAVFLAAASRIMPALLRVQSGLFSLRSSAGVATPTFELADDLRAHPLDSTIDPSLRERCLVGLAGGYAGFRPSVTLRDVWLSYPGGRRPAVAGVSLQVSTGRSLALVGSSGAGKTTLADLILGVLEPNQGSVTVSGVSPGQAADTWPGAIAYVPQETVLVDGTIRDNVALGLPRETVNDALVQEALERAHFPLDDLGHSEGLETLVGEGGVRLSGGQRQRIGLARAFFTRPKLIVLDEATSSLDAETESLVSEALRQLAGSVTLIVIAHRLSTVRDADAVAYLEEGRLMALGTFDDVKAEQANFARQAELLGL